MLSEVLPILTFHFNISDLMRTHNKYSRTQVLSFFIVFFLSIPLSTATAQVFESFESPAKGSYAGGTVDLPSGTWYLEEALIGNLANDVKKTGAYSVRMRLQGARLQMQFNKSGVGEVSFWHAIYTADTSRESATIKLQKSTNGGVSWEDVGAPFTSTGTMTQAIFPINAAGNHRFQIVIVSGSTVTTTNRRISIDDFRMTDYVEVSQNPAMAAEVNGVAVPTGGRFTFANTAVGQSRAATLLLRNTGAQALTISGSSFGSTGFRLATPVDNVTIPALSNQAFQILFEPTALISYDDSLRISSNDPAKPTYTIKLTGPTFDASTAIPISQARSLPLGTTVTVSGWITVANELGGPAYFQDQTGGLAAFWTPLHAAVQTGDSVVVSGPLGEFGNSVGITGDGLRQISIPAGSSESIIFSVHPSGRRVQTPKTVTITQLNAGGVEAQLIRLENVTIYPFVNLQPGTTPFAGAFQQNTNYALKDGAGNVAQLRIDNNTNLVGATAPTGPISVVGVVGRFAGTYQILPRSATDLQVEIFEMPYENIPKSKTFDAVTWNIEWFGNAGNGPADEQLQFTNALRVIRTIDADLYALQEISDNTVFARLVDSLRVNNYRGFVAPIGQAQKTAYLYKTTTIDSLFADFTGTEGQWGGGRWPYFFLFNATVDGVTQRIRAINIHAKAFATQADYDERVSDSQVIKAYMDQLTSQNVLLLGDFNDDVTTSTFNNLPSPYQNFVQDPGYKVITKSLSDRGQTSYSSFSNIDHIVANVKMKTLHLDGTERIENPTYVGSYLSTTSDHFPVWTRFGFTQLVSIDEPSDEERAMGVELEQNYPNPFNPTTVLGYRLSVAGNATLRVYDLLGREVAVLVDGVMSAGYHEVTFNAGSLSSGMYIYRLETAQGAVSKRMMLVK